MIKLKDVLQLLLGLIAVLGFIFGLGFLETAPLWTAGLIAAALWLVYVLMVVRARRHPKPTLWVVLNGRWTAMDGSGRTQELSNPPKNEPLLDQEGKSR